MKFLYWFRKIISIIFFLGTVGFIIAMFFYPQLNFFMWGLVIIFIAAILIWPNQATYCKKCGSKYDIDKITLLRTYKNVKENKNFKKTYVTYSVGHKCHCSKCNLDFAYSEEVKGGKIIYDKKEQITTDFVRPFEELFPEREIKNEKNKKSSN